MVSFFNISIVLNIGNIESNKMKLKTKIRLDRRLETTDISGLDNNEVEMLFRHACKNGKFKFAKLIVQRFKPANDKTILRKVLLRENTGATLDERIEFVKWYANYVEITLSDIRTGNNSLLRECCRRGNSELIKWFVVRFELTRKDITANSCRIFNSLYKRNNLSIAQWLIKKFNIHWSEHESKNQLALVSAIQNKDLPFIKFMIDHFKLTKSDFYHDELWNECRSVECMQWVIEYFELTGEYVKSNMANMIFRENSLRIEFILNTYKFTLDEIQKFGIKYINMLFKRNVQLDILKLFVTHFTEVDPLWFHSVDFNMYTGDFEKMQWLIDYLGLTEKATKTQ